MAAHHEADCWAESRAKADTGDTSAAPGDAAAAPPQLPAAAAEAGMGDTAAEALAALPSLPGESSALRQPRRAARTTTPPQQQKGQGERGV